MTNKQQYVERKKYKKEQIYDAIAKRIREICDLTDSVTSAECLKNTLLRMGYEIICTNDIYLKKIDCILDILEMEKMDY